jgi:hypothetical protein
VADPHRLIIREVDLEPFGDLLRTSALHPASVAAAGLVATLPGRTWRPDQLAVKVANLRVNPSLGSSVFGRYLSLGEREDIALLRAQGHGAREIARQLHRSPSTISRELRRNASTRTFRLEYKASIAQWHAERRARRPKVSKLAGNDRLRDYVQAGSRASGIGNATGGDTSASSAASSVLTPSAIAAQNLTRSSRQAAVGLPGEGTCPRYNCTCRCRSLIVVIAHLQCSGRKCCDNP